LQRFYGSLDWLNIPYKLLNAYAVMLPCIRAEETAQTIQAFACGSGNLEKSAQQKIFRDLQRQAEVVKDPLAVRKPKPVNYAVFAAMGIQVVDTRKTKKNDDGAKSKTQKV